jgi:light-regulated signal transduction histidine kinase (bacteriophytochrome)
MNVVVAKTLTILEVQIKENRAMVTLDRLPTIRVDKTQMIQVFQNIIGNAIKYRSREDPRIHISVQERGTMWVFAVQDNGIGLNMAYADRIMTMFQRLHTREEYPGTGVGLAICKRIIERHGGHIWVESEEGKGATFFFSIPKFSNEQMLEVGS